MDLMNELVVTVVGGVVTALILESFRRGGRRDRAEDTSSRTQRPVRRGPSFISQFIRMLLAVAGGVFFATVGFRYAIQNGFIERAPMMRIGFLVGGTVLCWLFLLMFRGRR